MPYISGIQTTADKVRIIDEHIHSPQKVYPTGAGGVVVIGAAGAWTLGSFAEIVPTNTIDENFDIHWLNIEAVSAAGQFELVLYAIEEEIARKRISVMGTPANLIVPCIRIQTPLIEANSQIQAKLMNAAGGSESMTISIEWHPY
jgi:hypothetical protein